MKNDLVNLAKETISNNQYMTIATSNENGNAWASPVAYVFDYKYNFYWVSVPESKHQQNINYNPNVSIAIFDSHQLWGEGVGVQIEATVERVSLVDLPKVTKLYFSREYPYGSATGAFGDGLKDLLKGKIYHFYKAIPTKVWVPDPNADVDARIEVNLSNN
ncbi:MAG: pyridoxamine 5'-phosphate oxidase family protein [Patescibacteria group bacterium]